MIFMEYPIISVIVPVYNVEKFLRRCIDSILTQSFTDFELLLIDDGSKDNSSEICDEYAKKDNRIKVFHKENGGVSSARNLGLDKARGEWVCFCDADDSIENDTFLCLYNYIKDFDADIISYPAFYEYENKILFQEFCYCNSPAKLLKEIFKVKRNEVWSSLIRREIIGLDRFPTDVKIGEDIIFLCKVYKKCMKGIISDKGCYNYYDRTDSAMCKIRCSNKQIQIDKSIISHVNEILLDRKDILIDFIYTYCRDFVKRNLKQKLYRSILNDVLSECGINDIFNSHLSCKKKVVVYACKLLVHNK